MVGVGFVINFTNTAFFGANTGGEVAEVVRSQRNVGRCCFANGLAVV